MKLANPACRKARKCQPFCGMCHLRSGDFRLITDDSLFGVCRTTGKCICKTWSHTANCYWINGRNVSYKSKSAGTYDCSPTEHPEHYTVQVTDQELSETRQSEYNKALNATEVKIYKEMRGLYGGTGTWDRGKSKQWVYNNQVRTYGGTNE